MAKHESAGDKPERQTLDVPDAGRVLGLGRGELPTIRVGGRLLVPRVPLERMLEGQE
jgi:hypothetical protein